MIELKNNRLQFSFPEVHDDAHLGITFRRTLRIPDDGTDYPLPPGLGDFPLRHVDDFGARVPGENWSNGIHRDPQDYMVTPGQPWLDGYCFEKGFIRQFVAMPLGSGYTVEEQIIGAAEHGGLQIVAYPMKAEAWEKIKKTLHRDLMVTGEHLIGDLVMMLEASPSMGLAPGGRMRQEIFEDEHDFDVWDTRVSSRCFVHIANSLTWRAITGEHPPTTPLTAAEYTRHGPPWFDYYDSDLKALAGAAKLAGVKSVQAMGAAKGDVPLPENESAVPGRTVKLGPSRDRVREGEF